MSHGPGTIERRIGELFAATRDRALSIGEIADHAFSLAGKPATRAQRISATRAAHRVVRRAKETGEREEKFLAEARAAAVAAVGEPTKENVTAYFAAFYASPAWEEASKLAKVVNQLGGSWSRHDFWRATATEEGRVYFHPPNVPVRVWAVSVQPAGVIWSDAEVVRITANNVMVRYAGDLARLDRSELWISWAVWRGVMFVSSRTGRAARDFDAMWQDEYGHAAGGVPPVMQMALAEAMALLGVPTDYSKDDIIAAFRREAKKAHPDAGGDADMFRRLVEARDRLLAALGTSEPAPRAPTFTPKGAKVVYHRVKIGSTARIGAPNRRIDR